LRAEKSAGLRILRAERRSGLISGAKNFERKPRTYYKFAGIDSGSLALALPTYHALHVTPNSEMMS
jgi:hypothetical protein